MTGLRFKDGEEIPADLVVMAAGIRPNIALAKSAMIHCERGIVVNDTMQTYDPKIYSVGECVQHRGQCYGLVAPLFEQAKVAANHLAEYGRMRYEGSAVSTKLKVTGIDLFSAGDFNLKPGDEELLLQDSARGVYKKLVLRDNKLRGAVMYGDTLDGPWYFQMMRDETDVSEMREHILFGQMHIGDAGRGGALNVAAMADSAEICGCNGVSKGTIVKTILDKKLFTLEEVRAHTKASSSCGSCTGLCEALLANTLGDYSAKPSKKALCACTEHAHQDVQQAITELEAENHPRADEGIELEDAGRLPCVPPRAELLPAGRMAGRISGRQPLALHQRTRACQHPEGRHLFGDPAHLGRRHLAIRIARDRRDRRAPRGAHRAHHRRAAHRLVRHHQGTTAEDVGRAGRGGIRFRPCLRQGVAHREDLRRFGVVPLRHAGFHRRWASRWRR